MSARSCRVKRSGHSRRRRYCPPPWGTPSAVRGYGSCDSYLALSGMARTPAADKMLKRDTAAARTSISDKEWRAAVNEGREMSMDDATNLALSELVVAVQ